jgi:uncharacterized protein YndB with AHSA1/START domain
MDVPDEVRKELTTAARRERVWQALTDADQIVRWFSDKAVKVDLRPGGSIRFEWEGGEYDDATIDTVEEPTRFAFEWHGAGFAEPSTLVEFTLEEVEGGTRVVVVERGFSKVGAEKRETAWKDNDGGWTKELGELKEYLEAA